MNIQSLNDDQLLAATFSKAKEEQKSTLELLMHLQEVELRRAYAKLSYSSLWEYVVKALGYSESQASERLNAMRLLKAVPEVKERLQDNKINLTVAASAQRFFQNEKKEFNKTYTPEQKLEVIQKLENASKREAEKVFIEYSPEYKKPEEKLRIVSSTETEAKFIIDQELEDLITRYKELKGQETLKDIFKASLKQWIKTNDPLEKQKISTSKEPATVQTISKKSELRQNQKPSRYIPAKVKHKVWQRSQGQCEYVDHRTKQRCQSRFRLEFDHRYPFALSGENTTQNIRHLCFSHNQRAAVEVFGIKNYGKICPL